MNVLGLDLSLTCTGVAKVQGDQYRTVAIKRPTNQRDWPELARVRWMLDQVQRQVAEPIGRYPWDLVVVEGLAFSRTTGQAMTRAGLWWLVVDGIDRYGAACAVMSPTCRARYATGKGNAGKADVMREVARRFPEFTGGEDEADALVLAAAGADWLGHPLVDLPKTHRAALDAVAWPKENVLVAD